jgi:tetratricopeptide (TPR) repeat protein
MRPLMLVMASLLVAGGHASDSRAASPSDLAAAKRLFEAAEVDQTHMRWAEALEKLERVVDIKETAGVRFHIAVCQEKLGQLAKSLESYERARNLASSAGSNDVLEMVGPEIERMRARVPRVRVEAPKGVGPLVVLIDQSVYADLPSGHEVRLDPGTHQVLVKVDGEVRLDRLVSLGEGQSETLRVRDWRSSSPAATSTPSENSPSPADIDQAEAGGGVPTVAWIALGAGAVLGVGGYLAYAKADDLAAESAAACARSIECDPDRADAVRRWDGLALGMWVGAAVGIGTGVGLVLAGDEGKPTTSLVLSPSHMHVRTTF